MEGEWWEQVTLRNAKGKNRKAINFPPLILLVLRIYVQIPLSPLGNKEDLWDVEQLSVHNKIAQIYSSSFWLNTAREILRLIRQFLDCLVVSSES